METLPRDPGQVLAQDVVVVLVNPLHPGNVGGTARAMATAFITFTSYKHAQVFFHSATINKI